jgi:hypothetical protein
MKPIDLQTGQSPKIFQQDGLHLQSGVSRTINLCAFPVASNSLRITTIAIKNAKCVCSGR